MTAVAWEDTAPRRWDALTEARAAELALARQITREAMRLPVPWAHDVDGPTAAWLTHQRRRR
jgi:hypothetical protein